MAFASGSRLHVVYAVGAGAYRVLVSLGRVPRRADVVAFGAACANRERVHDRASAFIARDSPFR